MSSKSTSQHQTIRIVSHEVTNYVMTSDTYVMTSKDKSRRQCVRHDVKVASQVVNKYAMVSKNMKSTSWRHIKDKVYDIKNYVMPSRSMESMTLSRQKVRHEVKNFWFYLKCQTISPLSICFKNILTPIWHFYDVSFPSYRRLCVFTCLVTMPLTDACDYVFSHV